MLNAAELAKQIREGTRAQINKACLIYGAPKTGKTFLAASIAMIPSIKQVIWFDTERGSDTLLSGQTGLASEHLEKIVPIFFRDTHASPRVAETMLKVLTANSVIHVKQDTGEVVNVRGTNTVAISYRAAGPDTAFVFDTISQVGDSVFALQKAKYNYRDTRKYWGEFHADMNAIMNCIQASDAYNILLAQEQIVEGTTKEEEKDRKVDKTTDRQKTSAIMVLDDRMIPVCGSQPYSLKMAKYPSTVVRLYIEKRDYRQLSNPTTIANVLGGSRFGVDAAQIRKPTMAKILGLEVEKK